MTGLDLFLLLYAVFFALLVGGVMWWHGVRLNDHDAQLRMHREQLRALRVPRGDQTAVSALLSRTRPGDGPRPPGETA